MSFNSGRILYFVAFIFLFNIVSVFSADLPANLTESERAQVQKYVRDQLDECGFSSGIYPDGSFYAPAEFEPADAVLFSWVGYSSLLTELIKEVTLKTNVIVVARSSYTKQRAESQLKNSGVNMNKVKFLVAPVDSVWMRDFGPWFVLDDQGDRGVIDLIYNRPRPNDDKVPEKVANKYNFKYYKPALVLPGGNLMVDGHGTAFMTDVVFDPSEGGTPSLTEKKLNEIFRNFYNVDRVVLIKKMRRDGTGHIDMFAKCLPNNVILVGQYATQGDGASGNYDILNENAKKLASLKDINGKPYKVVRIPMPKYTGTSYTYTNSLIVNKTVLVPVYGFEMDKKALKIYRDNLPSDYKVVGVDCNGIIGANGAIHCITKLIMSSQIKADVISGKESVPYTPRKVSVKISSFKEIKEASVYWKTSNDEQVKSIKLENQGNDLYEAVIPPIEDAKDVVIYIKDIRGMKKIVNL